MYLDHIRHKRELVQAMNDFKNLLDEKRELFQRTQPQPAGMREGSGSPKSGTDKVDAYLIEMERNQIDERIRDAREIVEGMKECLNNDEMLLRMSMDLYDMVYLRRYVERRPISDVASILHYSQNYIFKIAREIDAKIKTVK